jgi:hypothetical protein
MRDAQIQGIFARARATVGRPERDIWQFTEDGGLRWHATAASSGAAKTRKIGDFVLK